MMRYLWSVLYVLTTLFLVSCRQVDVATVSHQGNDFIFTFNKKYSDIAIANIQVKKLNCEVDCVYWDVRTKIGRDGNPTYSKAHSNPYVYGGTLLGMTEFVAAKPLSPGKYSASGSALLSTGKGTIFIVDFNILENDEGQLTVSKQD